MLSRLLLSLIAVLALTACGHAPLVVREKRVAVVIPKSLLAHCTATPPFERAAYLSATDPMKKEMLSRYAGSLLGDIELCNGNLDAINAYQTRQIKIIEETQP